MSTRSGLYLPPSSGSSKRPSTSTPRTSTSTSEGKGKGPRIPTPGLSLIGKPGTSGIAQPRPSGIAQPRPSGIVKPGTSGIAKPGTSGIAKPGTSGIGRGKFGLGAGTSVASTAVTSIAKSVTGAIPKTRPKVSGIFRSDGNKESLLKKFDRSVNEELTRRRDPCNVLCEATTSDVDLLDAVDRLAKAEAQNSYSGAIRAAEKAAAEAPPGKKEEAAVASAKEFEAELVDVVQQEVPGLKPIQVIGYVGITRPGKPVH